MNNKESQVILSISELSIVVKGLPDGQPLVDSLSFDLHQGEILGIVGESGSGKSISSLAILQLLSDQLSVNHGQINFEGQDLLKLQEEEIRKFRGAEISMIFQEPMTSLNPSMTCGAQVEEMLFIHNKNLSKAAAKSKVVELFAKTQLPDPERVYKVFPHQLSGGQIQRVMISMAIACNPKVLIADECTTALDVTVQHEIIELLKHINKELGISIIFISHDLGVIADIAHRVLVMKKGKLMEIAYVQDIFKNPQHSYTKQLIASRPPLYENLKILPDPKYFEDLTHTRSSFIESYHKTDAEVLEEKSILAAAKIRIKVNSLNKRYITKRNFWGKPIEFVEAIKDVSLFIKEGETLGLVGESGSGKSSLSKAMLRLIDHDSGDVFFEGKSLFTMSAKELRESRKDVQYIFQDPYSSLNPRLTIGFAIFEPMKMHNIGASDDERKQRVYELLELVGLEKSHYGRYPHEFSGGQRQRICIARALGLNPKLLVCDEIVSALDVSVQAQILNLLIDLKDKFKLSMLFVSHDLSIVKFISDRIIVMKDGQIVEEGDAYDLYENPKQAYTKTLIDAIPGKLYE